MDAITIKVEPTEGTKIEGCLVLDKETVLIVSFVPTQVGFNARLELGLTEYGGNVPTNSYDHARAQFDHEAVGVIEKGDWKCFLKKLPSILKFHNYFFRLEYAV